MVLLAMRCEQSRFGSILESEQSSFKFGFNVFHVHVAINSIIIKGLQLLWSMTSRWGVKYQPTLCRYHGFDVVTCRGALGSNESRASAAVVKQSIDIKAID